MQSEPETTRRGRTRQWAAGLLLTLVLPVGLYAVAAAAAAVADGQTPAEVPCFEPGKVDALAPLRMAVSVAMAIGAVGFLFVVPGLLGTLAFMRLPRTRPTAHAWSLAANSAALILICLFLRHTTGIHRGPLVGAWLGWNVLLFVLAWQPGRSVAILNDLRRRYGGGLLVGLVAVVVAVAVLFPEQFLQCFSEDGTETYELARSLRGHFLPYWELETWDLSTWDPQGGEPLPRGRMGTVVVNPSLVNSYWTCALQTLLGRGNFGGELATRLPYWVWWLAIFAVAYRLVLPRGTDESGIAALLLALLVFLMGLLFSFYVGYNQYMADLANPGVPDALFTLAMLLAFDCLRRKDGWGFVVSMVLASLVLYAGPVVLLMTLAAAWIWRPIRRKEVFRWGLRAVGLLLAIAVFYLVWGWREGSLPAWVDTADVEYVNDYLSAVPRWKSGPLFLGYFVLCCGGVPALGLVTAFRRGAWQRTVATATLLYLAVVLLSGFKNLHYLAPLLPIPLILFLSPHRAAEKPSGVSQLLAVGSLILCMVVCWPQARSTFTLNRQLGTQTTIATDSYLTAAQWARLRLVLIQQGTVSWYYDAHTWVVYSELDANLSNPRPLVLTDGGPPTPEYRLVAWRPVEGTDTTARLYARDGWPTGWLKAQRVLRPLDRYPAVLRPLADGPYSPHNNALEDVRRLRWPW